MVVIASCSFFLALHFGQRTPWFKQYLYYRLLAGNENQRLRAASMLVQFGAQKQLIDALHVEQSAPRDVARKALEYLWFNAAGPEAFRLVQAAYKAAEQDDFPNSLALLDRVVKQFPNFAEGWNQRASVYWRMGDYEKSIADSRRALALNPNHYGAWQGLGICKLKLGDVAEACRCLRAARKILPHDEPTQHALQECEQLLRKMQPATKPQTASQLI
jgi:tetratricopeptide (TPR) repeat protein